MSLRHSTIDVDSSKKPIKKKKLIMYDKTNWCDFSDQINIKSKKLIDANELNTISIDDLKNSITEIIKEVSNETIPVRSVCKKVNFKRPLPKFITAMIKDKFKLLKIYKKSPWTFFVDL